MTFACIRKLVILINIATVYSGTTGNKPKNLSLLLARQKIRNYTRSVEKKKLKICEDTVD